MRGFISYQALRDVRDDLAGIILVFDIALQSFLNTCLNTDLPGQW